MEQVNVVNRNSEESVTGFKKWLNVANTSGCDLPRELNEMENYEMCMNSNNPGDTTEDLEQIYLKMTTLKAKIDDMAADSFASERESLILQYEGLKLAAQKSVQDLAEHSQSMEKIMNAFVDYEKSFHDKLQHASDTELQALFDDIDRDYPLESAKIKRAELEIEIAQKQLNYATDLASGTKPIVTWRLDASKRVWQAQKDLKEAQKALEEASKLRDLEKTKQKQPEAGTPEAGNKKETAAEKPETGGRKSIVKADSDFQLPGIEEKPLTAVKDATKLFTADSDQKAVNVEELMQKERLPIKMWPKHVYTSDDEQLIAESNGGTPPTTETTEDGGQTEEAPSTGKVICYIRAPSDCLPSKLDVSCKFADPMLNWPDLPNNAEVIGKMVTITITNKSRCCILPNEPWIIGIPHSHARNPIRETVIFAYDHNRRTSTETDYEDMVNIAQETVNPWRDVHTLDVLTEDSRFLEMRLNRMHQLTLAPAVRVRRDVGEIGRFGGRLMCLADSRVSLTVPSGAIRVSLPFILQVQQIDQAQAQALREQHPTCMGEFLSSSPLVTLTCCTKKLIKPITITLPMPDQVNVGANIQDIANGGLTTGTACGGSGAPKAGAAGGPSGQKAGGAGGRMGGGAGPSEGGGAALGRRGSASSAGDDNEYSEFEGGAKVGGKNTRVMLDGFQKSLMLPQLLAGSNVGHSEVYLLKATENDTNWSIWTEAEIVSNKNEMLVFNLPRIRTCKFIAIKMRVSTDIEALARNADLLEKSLAQRMVFIGIRQTRRRPHLGVLFIALKSQLHATLEKLTEDGYTEGTQTIGPVVIFERQAIDLRFQGNIRLKTFGRRDSLVLGEPNDKLRIVFNSAVRSRFNFELEPVDSCSQIALDHYRGFLAVSYMHQVRKLVKVRAKDKSHKSRYVSEMENVVLCRLLITLPKMMKPDSQAKPHLDFQFESKGCVTPEYLRDLGNRLPDELWFKLGRQLQIKKTRLQAINGRNAHARMRAGLSPSQSNRTHEVLVSWIKTLPLAQDRVYILYNALMALGYTDYANDLKAMQLNFLAISDEETP